MFLGGSGESGDQNLQTVSLMFLGGSGESGDKNRAVPNVPEKVHNLVTITKQIIESWTISLEPTGGILVFNSLYARGTIFCENFHSCTCQKWTALFKTSASFD